MKFVRSSQILLSLVLIGGLAHPLIAEDAPVTDPAAQSSADQAAAESNGSETDETLATAVALNYCRASFHRIRQSPTEEVLREERDKILNNLNLSRLNDPEVIALYTSVLDEIAQIGITDTEHTLYSKHHKAGIRRQVTWDALAFGTDLVTAQFGSAIRTGANGWWDYRNKVFQRDIDLHKIEKTRVTAVVQRSSQFLDTFWKLARKKNIPDRWLVRGDDLDRLDVARQEPDPSVRLRVLRRMEPFMEAYPPFWYYVAKTEQELGNLTDAAEIYSRLESLGKNHFRKDELLATAMANQAAIYDSLSDMRSIASAQKSLHYSTEVWEANLLCARVLQRRGQIADAEDAILRNLDVDLEQSQSYVFLASLYYFARENDKLLAMMNNPEAVAHLPAPVLLRCASLVGLDQTPPVVVNNILASLEAYPRSNFGSDQLVVRVGHAWQLHLARLDVYRGENRLSPPQVVSSGGFHDLIYPVAAVDRGFPFGTSKTGTDDLRLKLTYPDETVVTLNLQRAGTTGTSDRITSIFSSNTPASMRIVSAHIGDNTLAFREMAMSPERPGPVEIQTSKPVIEQNRLVPEPVSDDASEPGIHFPSLLPSGMKTSAAESDATVGS